MSIVVIGRGGYEIPEPIARHEPELATVALYQLNGDLLDSGPNGFHLTEVGSVPYVPVGVEGKIVERAAKPTAANHGTHPFNAAFQIYDDLTLMNMVRMDAATSGLQFMFAFTGGAPDSEENNNLYRWTITTSLTLNYLAEFGSGANTSLSSSTALTREQWYHVAMTRDASGFVRFYIDGADAGSGATTTPTGGSSATLRVGEGPNSNDDLDGDLGSVHILNRVLSPDEIANEANRLLPDWQEMFQ